MKTSIYSKALVTGVAIATLLPFAAFAQVGSSVTAVGSAAQMPILYSSSGQIVNAAGGTTSLPAGYYYLAPGGQQVYYFGNGTYYNPATGEYGGSVSNPTGVAGTYTPIYYPVSQSGSAAPVPGTSDSTLTPGVPNTGAGGEALKAWITLIVTGAVVTYGLVHLAWSRRNVLG